MKLDRSIKISEIHPADEWGALYLQNGEYFNVSLEVIKDHPDRSGVSRVPNIKAEAKIQAEISVQPAPKRNKKELAAELVMGEHKFFVFKKLAREVLGDDCPKLKADMMEQLKKVASEPRAPVMPEAQGGMSWESTGGGTGPVNLTAWGEGQANYIFPDVMAAIETRYHKRVTNKEDAINFLVDEGVIEDSKAKR